MYCALCQCRVVQAVLIDTFSGEGTSGAKKSDSHLRALYITLPVDEKEKYMFCRGTPWRNLLTHPQLCVEKNKRKEYPENVQPHVFMHRGSWGLKSYYCGVGKNKPKILFNDPR